MLIRIALINNQYTVPKAFERFFAGRPDVRVQVFDFRNLDGGHLPPGEFDGVILTGTDDSPLHRPDLYSDEMTLVRSSQLPLLGICGGHQIMCLAHGANIVTLSSPIYGRTTILRIQAHPILQGLPDSFTVFSKHRFCVLSPPSGFVTILRSDVGSHLYGVAHRERQQYGVQFHPERRNQGERVLVNFLALVSRRPQVFPRICRTTADVTVDNEST